MKKVIALVLVLVCMLSFISCSSQETFNKLTFGLFCKPNITTEQVIDFADQFNELNDDKVYWSTDISNYDGKLEDVSTLMNATKTNVSMKANSVQCKAIFALPYHGSRKATNMTSCVLFLYTDNTKDAQAVYDVYLEESKLSWSTGDETEYAFLYQNVVVVVMISDDEYTSELMIDLASALSLSDICTAKQFRNDLEKFKEEMQ